MDRYPNKSLILFIVFALIVHLACPVMASEAVAYDFEALFEKVMNMDESEREALSKELSDALHAYPFEFIIALTQANRASNYTLVSPVSDMIAEYNTTEEGNADYVQFLLSLFPQRRDELDGYESNTFINLLLAFDPDIRNAGEDFTATLFTALRYADGIGADQCSTILFRVFMQDPEDLVKKMALEDGDFIRKAVISLNYGSWGHEMEFIANIEALAANTSLTNSERRIVDTLLEVVNPEEETTSPETEPESPPLPQTGSEATTLPTDTESKPATQISEPSGGNTPVLVIAVASILALGAIAYILNKKKYE